MELGGAKSVFSRLLGHRVRYKTHADDANQTPSQLLPINSYVSDVVIEKI